MKLFRAARRTSTTLASLAILALSTSSVAQTDGAASVLQRYGNLDIERIGPTIDAELGQKYLRRGNTYSNLEHFEEAIDEYRRAISADPNLTEAIRNLANDYRLILL